MNARALLALSYVCLIWGTTYLALRIGVMHYPPFLFAGLRQSLAGIILAVIAIAVYKKKDLSKRNILRQMLIGFLLLTLGNGLVSWAELYIASGVAALLCSLMPLFAVLFNLLLSRKEHFNALIGGGLLLGVAGVALIFRHDVAKLADPSYVAGMMAVVVATIAWAYGSILNKKDKTPVNPFFNSGLQLLFGGLFMLIISSFADDYSHFQLWNTEGFAALIYLIIFGSVLAYTAYMFALSKLPVGIATIYAYINPLIAVIVGYLVLNEELNIYTGLAFITIAISVFMVNRGYRKQHTAITAENNVAAAFPEAPVE